MYEKSRNFAERIVGLAKEEGLTTKEILKAVEIAKSIADESEIDRVLHWAEAAWRAYELQV